MLPHIDGEADAIASCFTECSNALKNFDVSGLDDDARLWIGKLSAYMDVSNTQDDAGIGRYKVKAKSFDVDEQNEISTLVDELAHWFSRA